MAKREHFTAKRVARFQCESGKTQTIYWDDEARGLGLRVTAAGARSYVFETSLHGKSLRVTIGDVDTWPIDGAAGNDKTARAEARRLKTLTDLGIDPRRQKAEILAVAEAKKAADETARHAADIEAKRQTVTMREAWTAYIEAMRSAKKDGKPVWCARYLADHEYVIAGKDKPAPLASLVDRRLVDLTPERIAEWLNDEAGKRPTSANIAFRKLRAFINWCADQKTYAGMVSDAACKTKAVTNALPTQKAKGDSLQREQLPLWFAEVGKLPLVVSTYLRILLLTGARRDELATLTWEKVNFKWGSLTIKDKVEGSRIIPLTPYVASLLVDLKRHNDTPPPAYRIVRGKRIKNDLEHWTPSRWVFSSRGRSGRIEGPNVAHTKALTTAGLPHISIHGLRRSFKSLAEWVEMPVGVVAQIMGHKQSATAEKHYTVRPLDLLRVWHGRYEGWLLEQAGIEFQQTQPGLRAVTAA